MPGDAAAGTRPGRRPPRRIRPQPPAERKQITVLFADLCGSTEQIARSDPEEAHAILSEPLRLMEEAVKRHGGTVSQPLGDGVLALFGAPLAQEDHALRACLAAIDMQQAARRSPAAAGRPHATLPIRVGIHSGEALVRFDHEHGFYRAEGTVLHVASRLERLALPNTVLIGAATQQLAGGQIESISLGSRAIRGFEENIELYEVAPSAGRYSPAAWAQRHYLGPLIGRTEVMARLAAVAGEARAGRPRIVGLRGEAGIGKSRIVAEFCHRMREAGVDVAAVGARGCTTHTPYDVATAVLRELMQVPAADPQAEKEAALALIAGWGEGGRRHAAAAIDLLGLGDPGETWRSLTPAQRRRRIGELLQWLIAERLRRVPLLVVVVEDIFLADRESQRLLEAAFRRLDDDAVLLLTTYRPDYAQRGADEADIVELWVGPLTGGEMNELARKMLGEDPSLEPVLAALLERADGNPFFLEQMALALVNDGTLVGTPGAYRCARADIELGVPASIAALIGARVDALPPAVKASLEAAAILGEPIRSELIGAMRGIGADAADDHLHAAVLAGLLGSPAGGDIGYSFRHALVQEAVAGALTRPRRRQLHRAAFDALHAALGEAGAERAAELVQHAYHGEAWAQAARYAQQSMARAIARSANRDALRDLETGLDAVRRLENDPAALPLELGLRLEALGALLPLGQMDAIVASLERAETITHQLGDVRREAAVLVQLAVTLWIRGSYGDGLAVAAKAARAAVAAGSRSLQMAAAQAAMMLEHGLGRHADVAAAAQAVLRDFGPELAARRIMPGWAVIAAVNARVFLADALRRMGQAQAAQQACSDGYRELAAQDHAFSRLMADFVQAALWVDSGRCAEAASLLRAALQACETHDVPTMVPAIVAALGGALAGAGEVADAIALLEKAIADKVQLIGGRYNDFYLPLNLGIALAAAGRLTEAIAAAAGARAAAAGHGQRGHEAEALLLLGEIEAAAGRSDAALANFRQAAQLARQCAMHAVEQRAQARFAQLAAPAETSLAAGGPHA